MPEEPVKYTIVDYRTAPSVKPDRRGQEDAMVTYETSTGIRDLVTIPAEECTPEKCKEAIEAHIRHKMQFVGQAGEVV